jgi:CheY-like chemotaxis protein
VGSASEALQTLGQQGSDAIVADIGLPDRDGYALIREIRHLEQQQRARHVPAIAVTAHASLNDRRDAISAGYDDHMGKPIDPERVAAALCAFLEEAGSG